MATPDKADLRIELLESVDDAVQQSGRPRINTRVNRTKWAATKGYEDAPVLQAASWLMDRGLLERQGMGPSLVITPAGEDEVERIRRERNNEAQQGAEESVHLTVVELRQIEPLLSAVRSLLEERGDELDPVDREDLQAQADTIEAQNRSPRPRRDVMKGAVSAIKSVAQSAAGGVVGNAAFHTVVEAATKVFG